LVVISSSWLLLSINKTPGKMGRRYSMR
jgi:hypothetical protein